MSDLFSYRLSHRAARIASATGAALALVAGLPATGSAAASRAAAASAAPAGGNPYSPAYQHPYRRGVVATLGQAARMRAWTMRPGAARRQARPASLANLNYGGGVDGIGVTTGAERVYLVFFGSQWGTQGTNANNDVTLAGDPSGEAPYLQQLYKGLGTGGESWSRVMTQYCQGVAAGAQTCPAAAAHAAYPAAPALAGTWVDESAASPAQASGHQLAAEAISAAAHFGNTTAAANRDAEYVILSPTGTNPDGFNSGGNFCAWHDWNGDPSLSGGPVTSADGDIAFTNLPYITDAGTSCGMDFVNRTGSLDGVSIVAGHEFAETVTDQNPPGGWTDSQGNEVADKCLWFPPGFTGGAGNLHLATGTFAMQGIWSNLANLGGGKCQFGGLLNGGFETGTLSGWTAGGKSVTVVSSGAHTGRHAARAGQATATNGSSSLSQTFTAGSSQFAFWYQLSCAGTVAKSWATAVLTDTTTHATVTVLGKRCLKTSGWKQVRHAVVVGHEYTLTLVNHDGHKSGPGSDTLLDDVTGS